MAKAKKHRPRSSTLHEGGIIAQRSAVALLKSDSPLAPQITELVGKKLQFVVCRNSTAGKKLRGVTCWRMSAACRAGEVEVLRR